MTDRLTVQKLQSIIGVAVDGSFGPRSRAALFSFMANPDAPALTEADLERVAARLGVPVGHIRGVRAVEAPRGAFDALGRPTILFERHKFRAATIPPGRFDRSNPTLSGKPFGSGGYGPFSAQYERLASACALDPHAAFEACSWGAFQVMGDNASALGYGDAFNMAQTLRKGESEHLDSFARFVETNGLVNRLRACRPNDPDSCRPFVRRYNGPNYAAFDYHTKFAAAIAV